MGDDARLRYALLVCALASRDDNLIVSVLRDVGLIVENCTPEFQAICATILFDTRMDFPEAFQVRLIIIIYGLREDLSL